MDPNLILRDASNTEFPEEYIDEVVISNTLSAPIHYNWDRDGNKTKIDNKNISIERIIKEEASQEDPLYLERKNLLKEALRVLKPGGVLSIYTDLIIYGIHSYEQILEDLKNTATLIYEDDAKEASRIDELNLLKLKDKAYCCCFRAEVLPRSEVHRFRKI
jgi:SAM-dependent methyltransferase